MCDWEVWEQDEIKEKSQYGAENEQDLEQEMQLLRR